MSEIWFYHLEHRTLQQSLPLLLEKALERGWRCLIRCGSQERMEALDAHLWTYSDDSFLAHGLDGGPEAAHQPVLLSLADGPPANGAKACFLIDPLPLPPSVEAFERVMVLFSGNDPDAVEHARVLWKEARAGGRAASYWQQGAGGGWQKKG